MNNAFTPSLHYRTTVQSSDRDSVRRVTSSSRFFSEAEITIAVELVEETLAQGPSAGYHFIFAEGDETVVGYSCFGPIPLTASSYDLYWIAVEEKTRGRKLGSEILRRSEEAVKSLGGTRIYVETSSRPLYEPTRLFYEKRGYRKETVLEDFYAPGDGKVIYVKALP